jgi:DNA polymerase III delta prime subunit
VTRIILITGPPGIGKTAVAQALAERLPGQTARLCGDVFLLSVSPFQATEERRLFLRKNLTSFTRHAVDHGYDWVLLEFVILKDEFIEAFIDSLRPTGCSVCVVSLLADGAAYRRRLAARTEYRQVSPQSLQACNDWMRQIRNLRAPHPIDTSALSIEQAAERIAALAEAPDGESD